MKYTLEELQRFLLEPSFDMRRFLSVNEFERFFDVIRQAIEYHEQLSNDNNAEHQ